MWSTRHRATPRGLLTATPSPARGTAPLARPNRCLLLRARPFQPAAATATTTSAPHAYGASNSRQITRNVTAHYGKRPSYGSSSSSSSSLSDAGHSYRTTMQLPNGHNAFAVIGKGGANQAWLRRESGGGRVDAAKGDPQKLLLSAPTAQALDRLRQLINTQVEAALKLGSLAYPHPEGVYYVLEEGEHGFGAATHVTFQERSDEVVRGGKVKGPVMVLAPGAPGALARAYFADSPPQVHFFPSGRMGPAAAALSVAVHRAVGPTCAEVEMQINLGKQLFYQVPQHMLSSAGLHVSELRVGGGAKRNDFRSVYSNWVTKRQVDALVGWLQSNHGFARQGGEAGARHRVKAHVINRRLNVKYNIRIDRESLDDRGPVCLRGVEPATQRCCHVSILGGPQQPDLRLKLQATGHPMQDPTAQAVAEALVAGCSSYGFARAVMAGAALPPGMELDGARAVTEHVYEGEYQVPGGGSLPMRVAVSLIADGGRGTSYGTHYEVEATLPVEQQALGALLASEQGRQGAAGRAAAAAGVGGVGQACGAEWAEGVLVGLVGLRGELGGSGLLLP